MLDLQTPAVRRARLIKNANLTSVIEMFENRHAGSGQIDLPGLAREMRWEVQPPHADLALLRQLIGLASFDVYSLRILLRENGIQIKTGSELSLSPSKQSELASYMTKFTRPLIRELYQGEEVNLDTFDDVLEIFRNPDVKKVQGRLYHLSQVLQIEFQEIPKFLEDYGDTFLSLSYYRSCLDKIMPSIDVFLASLRDFKKSQQLSSDKQLMRTCEETQATVNELVSTTTGWLENFERNTNEIWDHMSSAAFRRVEATIKSYQTVIGGILCALSVKMYAWDRLFPNRNAGGPVRRAEFVMTDMRLGLNKIQRLEASNPMPAAIAQG